MANLSIQEIPMGSQWVSTIGANDKPDKNDFKILIISDENVTGLTESGITLSAGATLVSITGGNSVWEATIRPPTSAGTVTVTVAANAVLEGNPETSKSIRVSTSFPDTDAEVPTSLITHGIPNTQVEGITVTSLRIIIGRQPFNTRITLQKYLHDGTTQTGETVSYTKSSIFNFTGIDGFNGDILAGGTRLREVSGLLEPVDTFSLNGSGIAHTRLGFMRTSGRGELSALPYGQTPVVTHDYDAPISYSRIAHQDNLLYLNDSNEFGLAEITDSDEIKFLSRLNIEEATDRFWFDFAIYQDTLYMVSGDRVSTLDIRPYRPVAKNTKSTIYPIFANEGDTIDLTQFSPDAERIVFDVGYNKPPFLTINSSNELAVASGAQTCFVKLKAINRIDATEADSFGFYLIIRQATVSPIWRDVSELTMRAGSRYDLYDLLKMESGLQSPPTIEFRSGRTRLTGSSLSNGMFTIGTVGGTAAFTARKGNRSSHIAIAIDVVQGIGANTSDVSGYRVEIAGIDVTADVLEFPSVSETLDPVVINESRVNEASITLRNKGGKYSSDIAGNFWETNGLNGGGFQNGVKIYLEHSDGSENLLFSGVMNESFEPIGDVTFKLNCTDISARLRKALVQSFGTLEKWDALRKQSDEDSYAGVYVPDPGLGQMQVGTGIARSDRTELAISRLELPSEGPAAANTGYMTPTEFRTAGGFLDANPLLRFMAEHRSEDVRFLVNQLSVNKGIYNTEIDIPGVEVEDPFLLNRGSVALSVEPTRTTRLPVDWVYDSTNNRVLILLSNPERHIADLLVQYDINSDSYRVLHTFDKGIAVHRIERRNATNYYILTSAKIPQDRSARELPRPNDSTVSAYDSVSEGSAIKIYHCGLGNPTPTLTEHVAEDDEYPPQLGIHYHVGFENDLYIDEFEGIRPDDRGAFKWYSGNLYYKYAKESEFGVARVNASGTTTQMIDQTTLNHHNHLNFAFDMDTSTGDLYCVYATDHKYYSESDLRDNLSASEVAVRIRIDVRRVIVSRGDEIGVEGTDASGSPLSERIDVSQFAGTDRSFTVFTTNRFGSYTSLDTSDLGRYNVTRILLSSIETAALTIKRRASNGSESTLFIETKEYGIGDPEEAFLGCHEALFHNNNLYMICPLQHVNYDENAAETSTRSAIQYTRSREKSAGMVLYRVSTNTANPTLEVIDKWDFVHQAGCNLVLHEGSVHYVEQPRAATVFKPINPDLDGYWTDDERTETMGYNVIEERLGALKKISSSGEVEDLGNVWHTDRPYNVLQTRMLSLDGDLHLCAGYGNLDEVLRYNSLASGADNMVHIVYGKTLHYVVPRFQPSGSVYAALADIAKKTNSVLSFEKNIIMITDRRPLRALTDGATGTGTADINFSDANKSFPQNGYLLIGKEILKYTGISSSALTGITRGVLGSDIESHADSSEILYLDNLIQTEKLGSPYKSINIQADVNRLFNVIQDSGGIAEVRDEESINLYGERPYNLDLGLTRHEKAWIEQVFAAYLEELKDLQSIVNIQVIPDFSLRLGQIVPFFYAGQVKAMRIVSIRYEKNTTHIKGRTVAIV